MMITVGLFIIAIGAFCQASCYLPINKIQSWSWESRWLVQGVFAWLLLPFLGAWMTLPDGKTIGDLFGLLSEHADDAMMAVLFGALWGIGSLTFGLAMRYLGVALGQSIALGFCAALGTMLPPVFLGEADLLTPPVLVGVLVTLLGIAIIGGAGQMKSSFLSAKEQTEVVKHFSFRKGIAIALLCGFMSACFSIGLAYGEELSFVDANPLFKWLPATWVVTIGGFITNFLYCMMLHVENQTFGDYRKGGIWLNNLVFCFLAGILWYCQFLGLSMGRGFFAGSAVMVAFSWCVLMALNVLFSNVWGLILKEWKGCPKVTITLLVLGMLVLILSSFLPQLLSADGVMGD